jgi:hypothetical protein
MRVAAMWLVPYVEDPHASAVVASCMSRQVVCLHPHESVGRIEWVLRNTQHNGGALQVKSR